MPPLDWTTVLGFAVGAATAWIGTLISHRCQLDSARTDATLDHKIDCYQRLVGALQDLAFKLALERKCAADGKDGPALASADEMNAAKKAILMAHVCGGKPLLDAAWAAFAQIVSPTPDDAKATELLCRLVTEVRVDLGLKLAPFDQKAVNDVERLMVHSCCTRERYRLTVSRLDGRGSASRTIER